MAYIYYSDQLSSDGDGFVDGYIAPPGVGDAAFKTITGQFNWRAFPSEDDNTIGTAALVTDIAVDDVFVFCPIKSTARVFWCSLNSSTSATTPTTEGGGWNAVATSEVFTLAVGLYRVGNTGELGEVVDVDYFHAGVDLIGARSDLVWARGASYITSGSRVSHLLEPEGGIWAAGAIGQTTDVPLYICGTVTAISDMTLGGRIMLSAQVKGM